MELTLGLFRCSIYNGLHLFSYFQFDHMLLARFFKHYVSEFWRNIGLFRGEYSASSLRDFVLLLVATGPAVINDCGNEPV